MDNMPVHFMLSMSAISNLFGVCTTSVHTCPQAVASGGSKSNAAEAQVAVAVVAALVRAGTAVQDIGVITPYVAQVGCCCAHISLLPCVR